MHNKLLIIFIVVLSIGIFGCPVDPGSESEPTPTPIDEPTPIGESTPAPTGDPTPIGEITSTPTDDPTPSLVDGKITLTITNSSSLNPADSTLTIAWGPYPDIEGEIEVIAPTFPYVYEILSYTPDESFVILCLMFDSEFNMASGSDEWDTSDGGDYISEITLTN